MVTTIVWRAVPRRVRAAKSDEAAVSEIVGALFLIVIVSVSASSLALFVQHQQKEAQTQKQAELERSLESVAVAAIAPEDTDVPPDAEWDRVTLTIVSLHPRATGMLEMRLNGHAVAAYDLTRIDRATGTWETAPTAMTYSDEFQIEARERVRVTLDIAIPDFFEAFSLLYEDAVQFDVVTTRANTFSGFFQPPDAIALVDIATVSDGAGGFDNWVVLDGRLSGHVAENARILKWEWWGDGVVFANARAVRHDAPCGSAPWDTGADIVLVVTDSFGMVGQDRISAFQCS